MGFDPVLVDLDGERPNEPQRLPDFYAAPQYSICAKEIEAALRLSAAPILAYDSLEDFWVRRRPTVPATRDPTSRSRITRLRVITVIQAPIEALRIVTDFGGLLQ